MSQENKNIQALFYRASFSFLTAKFLLAATTFIAGFNLGMMAFAELWSPLAIPGGILVGMASTRFLDGELDGNLRYLLETDDGYFYFMAVVLSLATGGSTWWSTRIIGDTFTDQITPIEKEDILAERIEENTIRISDLKAAIEKKEQKIADLDEWQASQRELILNDLHPDHKKLVLTGLYTNYYGKSRYGALTRAADKFNTQDSIYKTQSKILRDELATLTGSLTKAEGKDVSESVDAFVANYNLDNSKKSDTITWYGRYLDIACVLGVWLIFFRLKRLKKKYPEQAVFQVSFDSATMWVTNTLATFKNKAMITDTKLDDGFVAFISALLKIFSGVFYLFSWVLNLVFLLIVSPTKIGSFFKGVFNSAKQGVSNTSNTGVLSWLFGSSNRATQIVQGRPQVRGFQQSQKPEVQIGKTDNSQTPEEPVITKAQPVLEQKSNKEKIVVKSSNQNTSIYTVNHKGKEVGVAYVNTMINNYQNRVNETLKRINQNGESKQDKNTLSNRLRNLEYWKGLKADLELQINA